MPYKLQYLTTRFILTNVRRCGLLLLLALFSAAWAQDFQQGFQNVITLTPEQAAAMGISPTGYATLPASALPVNATTGAVMPGLEAVTMVPMGTLQGNTVLQSAPGTLVPSGFVSFSDGALSGTFVDISAGMPVFAGFDAAAFEIVTPVTPPSMVAIRTTEDMQQLRQDTHQAMQAFSPPSLSPEELNIALQSAQIYSQPFMVASHAPLTAEVLVLSSPLHADMFIAGQFVGTTPLVLEVPINSDIDYELLARDSRPFRGRINVSQNEQLFVQLLRAPSP